MEGFDELQRMYRESLPEKRVALQTAWKALQSDADAGTPAQALKYQLHQLAGSAGAYGYEAMGEMARGLEKRIVQWLVPPAPERSAARGLAAELAPLMNLLFAAITAASLPAENEV